MSPMRHSRSARRGRHTGWKTALRRDGALYVVLVSRQDTTPPVVQLPSGGYVEAQATSPEGAVVEFTVTATDDDDPDPLVVCAPASGSFFPLGGTDVWCTACDDAGNRSEPVRFTVWVKSAPEQVAEFRTEGVDANAPL